jgi:hypothetical protein
VVGSVKQRDLLNPWLRARGRLHTLPVLGDYQPDRIVDELADIMGFDIVGEDDSARFLIAHEGTRLTSTYGNDHVDPDAREPTATSTMQSGRSATTRAYRPTTLA